MKPEYKRGYADGYALKNAEHVKGKPEPWYKPMKYPDYVEGHKAGMLERQQRDASKKV